MIFQTNTEHAGAALVDGWEDVLDGMEPLRKEKELEGFFGKWSDHASAKHSNPGLFAAEALRKLYPKHSIVSSIDFRLDLLAFPAVEATPLENNPLVTVTGFLPLIRLSAPVPGMLTDRVVAGGFSVKWMNHDFLLFVVQYPSGFGITNHSFLLNKDSEDPCRALFLACGLWSQALHNEIWVFNQGFWQKDGALWQSVQKADWKDVILKDDFMKAFQKDVYGFFDAEALYRDLGIPWKRGLIMHGPPGNGKTISMKVIIKTCDAKGYAPLYVKSFQSFAGDEVSIRTVFNKARQLAPCVLVLEDLDSLITDRNRSFFLNELDGLEGNDGLLVLATTNHFDRLDPGLSTRPSRFDRKYLFDDPDREERVLYSQYWQKKLGDKDAIDFPDSLVEKVADATDRFSFAYLKEAFVSALVTLAGIEDEDKPSFGSILMKQVDELRKQLDKPQPQRKLPISSVVKLPSPGHAKQPSPHPRPLPLPSNHTPDTLRRLAGPGNRNLVLTPPSPPPFPVSPLGDAADFDDIQQRKIDDLRSLYRRINALRVPGGFGSCDEDNGFPRTPSPSNGTSSGYRPGGYWGV